MYTHIRTHILWMRGNMDVCSEHRERVIIAVPRSLAYKNVVGLFMHFILDIRKKIIPNNNHNRFDEWKTLRFSLHQSILYVYYDHCLNGHIAMSLWVKRISRISFPILQYIGTFLQCTREVV